MMEMTLVLAMMLRSRFDLAPGRPVVLSNRLTLRPSYGMWMVPEFSSGVA